MSEPFDGSEPSRPSEPEPAGARYAYRASLIGAARRFELTDEGLWWHAGGKSALWPYHAIASVRLSYRPIWMQPQRFRADIENAGGERLTVLSTSWHTATLMAAQDHDYRTFIGQLHRRLAEAGGTAVLAGGLKPATHVAALVLLALVATAIGALAARAVVTGELAGLMFLLGFAALFAWRIGGFIRRNRPRRYRFDDLPAGLIP